MRCERDAFDTLFDHAPEKLAVVKKSLVTFVNKHLNKLNFDVNDLGSDFKDGVYLCLLMGLLGGFFVPLYDFHLTPKNHEQMVSSLEWITLKPLLEFDLFSGSQRCLLIRFDARRRISETQSQTRRHCQFRFEIDIACSLQFVHQVQKYCLNLSTLCVLYFLLSNELKKIVLTN